MQVLHIFWPDSAICHSQFRPASLKFRSGYETVTRPVEAGQSKALFGAPLSLFASVIRLLFEVHPKMGPLQKTIFKLWSFSHELTRDAGLEPEYTHVR